MLYNICQVMMVIVVIPLAAQAAEETQHVAFMECILHKGEGGQVWVSRPLVGLGMIGVQARSPHLPPQSDIGGEISIASQRTQGTAENTGPVDLGFTKG